MNADAVQSGSALTDQQSAQISAAVAVLGNGGVIAYPTEHCFGLGCDPRDSAALAKLLRIKQREKSQGVILIAADLDQVALYGDLAQTPNLKDITDSWPGPNTWLFPAGPDVSEWVRGRHSSVAMRVPGLPLARELCREFGHPIVSTSANRHGQPALLTAEQVRADMGEELDYVVDAPVGGADRPSVIRDALTGSVLR